MSRLRLSPEPATLALRMQVTVYYVFLPTSEKKVSSSSREDSEPRRASVLPPCLENHASSSSFAGCIVAGCGPANSAGNRFGYVTVGLCILTQAIHELLIFVVLVFFLDLLQAHHHILVQVGAGDRFLLIGLLTTNVWEGVGRRIGTDQRACSIAKDHQLHK